MVTRATRRGFAAGVLLQQVALEPLKQQEAVADKVIVRLLVERTLPLRVAHLLGDEEASAGSLRMPACHYLLVRLL